MRCGMMNSGPATGFVHVLFSCSFPIVDRHAQTADVAQRGEDG